MAGCPEHCRRHLSFVPLISCSTRSQAFCERTSGENVLSTSEASSAERQRILTCGAAGAPLMLGELVTFQKPGWMPSARAGPPIANSSPPMHHRPTAHVHGLRALALSMTIIASRFNRYPAKLSSCGRVQHDPEREPLALCCACSVFAKPVLTFTGHPLNNPGSSLHTFHILLCLLEADRVELTIALDRFDLPPAPYRLNNRRGRILIWVV